MKPCCGEKPDGTQCDGHPILRARKNVCHFLNQSISATYN